MLLACAAVSCQTETHAVFTPAPSPTPHAAPTAAILQSGDVPAGLSVCLGSGPMDVYLSVLASADTLLAERQSNLWQQLRTAGATAGAISVFAANPTACKAELGAVTAVKAMTSVVIRF